MYQMQLLEVITNDRKYWEREFKQLNLKWKKVYTSEDETIYSVEATEKLRHVLSEFAYKFHIFGVDEFYSMLKMSIDSGFKLKSFYIPIFLPTDKEERDMQMHKEMLFDGEEKINELLSFLEGKLIEKVIFTRLGKPITIHRAGVIEFAEKNRYTTLFYKILIEIVGKYKGDDQP